jgi:hypothetical protein
MDYQLIAKWLGLPPGVWPPDHYALLGLTPGETNLAKIEQHVHERMARVRSYQLSCPELATEAMQRLAQAFDCLTSAQAKKSYDATCIPKPPQVVSTARVPTALAHDTAQIVPVSPVPPSAVPLAPPAPAPATPDSPVWWAQQEMVWNAGALPPPVRDPGDRGVALPLAAPEQSAVAPPAEAPQTSVAPPMALLADNVEPPPVRLPPAEAAIPAAPPPGAEPPINGTASAGQLPALPAKVPTGRPVDPVYETAKSSPVLRQGLATRHGLYERAVWLRQLLTAWERAGKHLSKPKKRLTRNADEADLARQLEIIEELLQEQPSLLGQPGQPGYRVLALAHHEPIADGFKALDEQQRDLLARDWIAGRMMLRAHRKFICQQVKRLRLCTTWQRLRRATDATLTDHRGWVLLLLVVVALLVLVGVYFL